MSSAANDGATVVDLAALVQDDSGRQPVWAYQGTDLNANLLVWDDGEGVSEHVNGEVDVLIVGIAGIGVVSVNDVEHPLRAGQAIVVPKGTRRAIRASGSRFAYLTCHRRRAGLWPEGVPRSRP